MLFGQTANQGPLFKREKEISPFILSAFIKHFHSDNILTEMRNRMHSMQRFVCVLYILE